MAACRGDTTPAFGPGTHARGAHYKSKSSRVGPARDADGQPTTAYRAGAALMWPLWRGDRRGRVVPASHRRDNTGSWIRIDAGANLRALLSAHGHRWKAGGWVTW